MTSVQTPPPPKMFRKPFARKRSRIPMLWLVIACGVICAALIFAGIKLFSTPWVLRNPVSQEPVFSWQGSPGQKVILVMGVDAPNRHIGKQNENAFDGTRTDTMMLVRVNADKKQVSLVSIPRDSKVYLAGNRGVDKINAAHALGGPDLAVQTVQDSFGIPIDSFLVINLRGVRDLVDSLGGIDLYIEKSMHYTDNTAKLFINFEPGQQHLNGKQAEAFLRFRHDQLGDIGRIRRQQQFISAVSKKLREPGVVFKIPAMVQLANQYLETNLNANDLLTLAFFGKDLNLNSLRTATLPGHPGGSRVSYWVIDPEPAQLILDRLILDNPQPLFGEGRSTGKALTLGLYYDPALAKAVPALVKNLEAKGFDVVCKDSQRRSSTQIIEHTSRVTDSLTETLRTADARLGKARLIFAPVGTTFENNACSTGEDYTLILGADSR
ncbi:LCP family protein [Vampirovibrio sp.]|uniref:LCP family protein n=1 Tax=Vampirovibrio sp. TaxID=2717857 RepID=UPI0035938CB5